MAEQSIIPGYMLEAKTQQELCDALAKLTGLTVYINSEEAIKWCSYVTLRCVDNINGGSKFEPYRYLPKGYLPCQVMGCLTMEQRNIVARYGVYVDKQYGTIQTIHTGDKSGDNVSVFEVFAIRSPENTELFDIAQRMMHASHERRLDILKDFTDSQGVHCKWQIVDRYGVPSYQVKPYNCQSCIKPGTRAGTLTCEDCNDKIQSMFTKLMELLRMIGHCKNSFTEVGCSNIAYYLDFYDATLRGKKHISP